MMGMVSINTHDVHQDATANAQQAIEDTQQDAPADDDDGDLDDNDANAPATRPLKRRKKTRRVP